MLCYRGNPLQSMWYFGGGQEHLFCQWTSITLQVVPCHSEWHVECLPFSFSFSFSFHLSLPAQHQFWRLSQLQQSVVPLQFPLTEVVVTSSATPPSWAFYFQGSGVLVYCHGAWSGFMCEVVLCDQGGYRISFFPDLAAIFESGWQAWYYSYSSMFIYPS